MNITDDDEILTEMLKTACIQFEKWTDMVLTPTSFTQTYNENQTVMQFMRHPFVSLTSAVYINEAGNVITAANEVDFDLDTTPMLAELHWRKLPALHQFKRPKITLTFVAGVSTILHDIKTVLASLAAYYYQNPEAYSPDTLTAIPQGFESIANYHWHGRGFC